MASKTSVTKKAEKETTLVSVKAPVKRLRARVKTAGKKEKSETFIATVAEMPVAADAGEARDKQIQTTAIKHKGRPKVHKDSGFSAEELPTSAAGARDVVVTVKSLAKYLDGLKRDLSLPFVVTGARAFGWERLYAWQIGDSGRHEELKSKNPSFTDQFELVGFDEDFDELSGIVARVVRLSDKKEFLLPLCDLRAVEEGSKNAGLLSEYCEWFMK